ncbi:protein dehydratase [Croceicoccus ponticola]|uniref:Protein dehydratase n=1 Tax=Croceicoccus ponticola TaxID=2217664 RepID=A0A437H1X7_9SPHN|nr:MaoC family dehydratase N-terminal domain-containing protein [Croceicoccus ponticola]RVQ69638.1 protein dehydratase [Croceicoccus ponticola]
MENLQEWLGRTETVRDVLQPSLVDRFVATLPGFDSLPSGRITKDGDPAPRLIHFCLSIDPAPQDRLDVDGHPLRGGFLPPVPLPRRMWAASEIEFHANILIGSAVDRHSRIAAIEQKEGRNGTLCFVTVEHLIYSDARLCIEDRQTIVYREATKPEQNRHFSEPKAEQARGSIKVIAPSTPLLFRYSALTFNSHRIHYDRDYATQAEGYPGLVVQGPLQATLLYYHCADAAGGRLPDRYRFRGVAPLCAPDPFELRAEPIECGEMHSCTVSADGATAMKAVASWR